MFSQQDQIETSTQLIDAIAQYIVTMSQRLIDKGVEFQYMSPEICRGLSPVRLESLAQSIDLAEGKSKELQISNKFLIENRIKCNDIILAVLRRTKVRLQEAVDASSQSVSDSNNLGETALHLSLDWLSGIKVLLDAKAELNRDDRNSLTRIMLACELSLLDAVRLLGNAGSALNVGSFDALSIAMIREPMALERRMAQRKSRRRLGITLLNSNRIDGANFGSWH